MKTSRMIEFGCPACRQRLVISGRAAGRRVRCLQCAAPLTVPMHSRPLARRALPTAAHKDTVPIRLCLPRLGRFETQVRKSDAGKMAFCFLGGALTLVAVVAVALLGGKFPTKS